MATYNVELSTLAPGTLIVRNRNACNTPVCWFHVASRQFGKLEYTSSQFVPIEGIASSLPEEVIARCMAYSIAGILAEQL